MTALVKNAVLQIAPFSPVIFHSKSLVSGSRVWTGFKRFPWWIPLLSLPISTIILAPTGETLWLAIRAVLSNILVILADAYTGIARGFGEALQLNMFRANDRSLLEVLMLQLMTTLGLLLSLVNILDLGNTWILALSLLVRVSTEPVSYIPAKHLGIYTLLIAGIILLRLPFSIIGTTTTLLSATAFGYLAL